MNALLEGFLAVEMEITTPESVQDKVRDMFTPSFRTEVFGYQLQAVSLGQLTDAVLDLHRNLIVKHSTCGACGYNVERSSGSTPIIYLPSQILCTENSGIQGALDFFF